MLGRRVDLSKSSPVRLTIYEVLPKSISVVCMFYFAFLRWNPVKGEGNSRNGVFFEILKSSGRVTRARFLEPTLLTAGLVVHFDVTDKRPGC